MRSQEELAFLQQAFGLDTYAWVGASGGPHPREFTWADGSELNPELFSPDEAFDLEETFRRYVFVYPEAQGPWLGQMRQTSVRDGLPVGYIVEYGDVVDEGLPPASAGAALVWSGRALGSSVRLEEAGRAEGPRAVEGAAASWILARLVPRYTEPACPNGPPSARVTSTSPS